VIDAEKELAKLAAAARPTARKAVKAEKAEKAAKADKAAPPAGRITIRLVGSGICTPRDQKATLRGLGLRRLNQAVVRPDVPAIRGMVRKVRHLVRIEES
jgi:large subunit ribosomal protein L30